VSLYRAEVRRLLKRRFIRYLVLAGLLVLVAILVGMFFTNQKVGPADVRAAEVAAEEEYRQTLTFVEQERKACEDAKAAGTTDEQPGRFPQDCSAIQPPPREAFSAEWHLPPTFQFREEFGEMLTAFAAILAMVAFVAGASFVGAEWSTGGMMNLLLWRPQRLRVLLTKLGAFLSVLFGLSAIAAVGWTAGFWLVGSLRGTTERMTSGAWQSFGLMELRGIGLILALGTVGFALASLGRHTAVALGGAIGAIVVGQFGVGILLAMAQVPFIERYLAPTYLAAWMEKKVTLENWNVCNADSTGQCRPETLDVTWQQTGILMAAALVVAVGAAMWVMRRRDIT
jgi:ABC-2 type transport system permease protein